MRRLTLVPLAAAFLIAACADSPTSIDPNDPEIELVVVRGNAQTGVVGKMLGEVLIVRVGTVAAPVAGALVNFVVASGGGHVWAGSALTNSAGIAKEWWTLGTSTDSAQVLEVRAVAPNGDRRVYGVFTATAIADVPATVERIVPNAVSPEGLPIDPPTGLHIHDRFGNAVPDYPVYFNIRRGGGTVTDTVRTDADGLALAEWTPGAYDPLDSIARLRMTAVGPNPPSDSVEEVQTRVYPVTGRTLVASTGDGQSGPISESIVLCVGLENDEGGRVAPHAHHLDAVTWTRNGAPRAASLAAINGNDMCFQLLQRVGTNDWRATIRGMAGEAVFNTTGT